jgi:hypothetical protein
LCQVERALHVQTEAQQTQNCLRHVIWKRQEEDLHIKIRNLWVAYGFNVKKFIFL